MNRPNNEQNLWAREIILQSFAYKRWVEHFSNLVQTRFEWSGLPDSIDGRYLEKHLLFFDGKFGVYDNKTYGLVASKVAPVNNWSVYDHPTQWHLMSRMWSDIVPYDDVVICRNNVNELPSYDDVCYYAYKLATLEYAIDKNIEGQQYSFLIPCDKSEMLTMKNVITQHKTGQPIIYGSKNLDISRITPLPITPPLVADKLTDLLHTTYNEALRHFGISSAGEDKAERVQTAEISALNEETGINTEIALKFRKEFCTELNKKFGTNVSVKLTERVCDNVKETTEDNAGTDGNVQNVS